MTDEKKPIARPPHVELYLAGDLSSPFEVLAAKEFSMSQKREILQLWHSDLLRRGGYSRHAELLFDVERAMNSLSPEIDGDDE
ncbi:MAG: hypothetical protein KJ587_17550 [Alphaproteobacteria bacterium]|nr:hypothetical protein [Alphaproteobacteria bacterium]